MFKNMSPVLLTTLVAIVVLIVAAPYLRPGSIRDGQVGLEIGVPASHILSASPQLPVVLRLHNRTDEDVQLTAETRCKVFRFVVTNSVGTFMQASGTDPACTSTTSSGPVTETLFAGDIREEIHIVPLSPTRFQPGEYEIQTKFWGYIATAPFQLTQAD